MRILGVDYGLKRIGLAIGESEVAMAFAREAASSRGSPGADAQAVAEYARVEGCELIVIGLPLLVSGEEGQQARLTREFGDALQRKGLGVVYWDERFSSYAAEIALSHVVRERRKELIDSEAARQTLSEYLAATARNEKGV